MKSSWGLQKVEATRFQDSRLIKVVRLSVLRPGRLYSEEIFLELISVEVSVIPRVIVRMEWLCVNMEQWWNNTVGENQSTCI